ncbi:MAG: TIGR03862 family flavoprotein [Hyphomicrobiales bacterium]|jgi:uncharacterized flavoprotein (TIGR03862 family)
MATDQKSVVIVGSGPAGLMAADVLSNADVKVIICEAKPSVGRKFLMAGKSGLNLTKDEPDAAFLRGFYEAAPQMQPMLAGMGPSAVKRFAKDLEQEVFTGSSGRVFPKAMKASPMLRAWLARLVEKGVEIRTGWRWMSFEPSDRSNSNGAREHLQDLRFETPDGPQTIAADATVLALGGASWSRLGSDGAWTNPLAEKGVAIEPFKPANMGLCVDWSEPMAKHFGAPVKGTIFKAGDIHLFGECVVSANGLEGGGIYAVSRAVREGAPLTLDLLPGTRMDQAIERLSKPRGGDSIANFLRKALKLSPVKRALLMEFGRPLPTDPSALASLIKTLPVIHQGPRPIDEAISVAGGVAWDAVDDGLMLRDLPGVFCAGEMLDWEAPTGGYLITGCLATGKWAGSHARDWISS